MNGLICDISKAQDICFCSSSFNLNTFIEVPFIDADSREGCLYLSEGSTFINYFDEDCRYAYGEYVDPEEAAPYRSAILKMLDLSEQDLSDRLRALYFREERALERSNEVCDLQHDISDGIENALADLYETTGTKTPASLMAGIKERTRKMIAMLMDGVPDPITVVDDGQSHASIIDHGKIHIDEFVKSTMDYIASRFEEHGVVIYGTEGAQDNTHKGFGGHYDEVFQSIKGCALDSFRSINAVIEGNQPQISDEER